MSAGGRQRAESGSPLRAGRARRRDGVDAGTTGRGAARRAAVLEAALARFLEQGVAATTVEQICADSGSSTGSVYHLFGSKEGLAAAVFAESAASYQRSFVAALDSHDGAEEGIKAAVRFHIDWCRRNPAMARFLLEARDPAIAATPPIESDPRNVDFFQRVGAWWRLHAHYGSLRRLDLEISYALWMGPTMELTRHWLGRGGPEPGPEDVEALAEGAWRAVGDGAKPEAS